MEEHLKSVLADTGSEIPFPSPASLTRIPASMMNLAVQNTVLGNYACTTRLVLDWCYTVPFEFSAVHGSALIATPIVPEFSISWELSLIDLSLAYHHRVRSP